MKYEGFLVSNSILIDEIVSIYQADFNLINTSDTGDVHNFPEMVLVIDGNLKIMVDNMPYTLKKGDMIIYAPNTYHISDEESDAKVFILSFKTKMDKIKNYYNKKITLSDSLFNDCYDFMVSAFDIFSSKILKNGTYFLSSKAGVPSYKYEVLKKKIELFILNLEELVDIDEDLSSNKYTEFAFISEKLRENVEKNLTIKDMARICAMSVPKFKIVIRKNFDISPMLYFHKLKIEKAKEYLHNGEHNITEISEMLGFNSVHYFSRFFKKHTGVSPNTYKNSMNDILISVIQDTEN